jgi:hypothetical protein
VANRIVRVAGVDPFLVQAGAGDILSDIVLMPAG